MYDTALRGMAKLHEENDWSGCWLKNMLKVKLRHLPDKSYFNVLRGGLFYSYHDLLSLNMSKVNLENPSCSWTIIILPLNTWKIFSLCLKGTSKHQIHEDKSFFANIIELLKIFAWETAYLISVMKSLFITANKLLQKLTVSVVWWIKWHTEKTKNKKNVQFTHSNETSDKREATFSTNFSVIFFFIN